MSSAKPQLIRAIGALGASFLVINGMIGSGIFALPGAVAERAGLLSPVMFIAAGLLIIVVVLAFAELGSYFRDSGGPALYATRAFGPLVGFSTSWVYYISRIASTAANSHALALYLGVVWPWFDTTWGHRVVVVVVLAALTLINVRGVKDSVRTLALFTFFKVVPLLMLILLGLQFVSPDVLFPEPLPTIEDPGGTMLLLIYAYIGFEALSMTAGETKQPRRTIPWALVWSVIAVAGLYYLIMLVYVAVLPDELDTGATLADVARRIAGPVGAVVIALTAAASITGNLSGSLLAGPRLTLSMAEQGLVPAWIGNVHPKFLTPANSIVLLGGLAMLVALTGTFVKLAIASSLARLIAYGVSIAALPVIRRAADEETRKNAFRLPGGYLVPAIALGLCVWMASYSSAESWRFIAVLLVAGFLIYGIERIAQARAA